MYRQLEIHWVNLNLTRGVETQQKRQFVILQSDLVNRETKTVVAAPILPKHKNWPFVMNITPSEGNGLDKERHINLKQLRIVDVSRIDKKQGILEKRYLESIKNALCIVFNLEQVR